MVRSRRGRSQRGRGRRARGRGRGRVTALPPHLSILGSIYRTVVQIMIELSVSPVSELTPGGVPTPVAGCYQWSEDINSAALMAPTSGYQHLFHVFSQTKVFKIVAHYVPFGVITSTGEYCFMLADFDENASNKNSFERRVGSPGTVVRKIGHPAFGVWFPTEPDDRNWHTNGDSHAWATLALASIGEGSSTSLKGRIIIDVHVAMRGRSSSAVSYAIENNLETDYLTCKCGKCMRVRARKALEREVDEHKLCTSYERVGVSSDDS